MSKKLVEKVSFEFIRYANCWEDAEILLKGLAPEPGNKILSIGSAGDNSFSLLTTNPALVVSVDVNKTQLWLIELKKIAIQQLSYNEILEFLGFKPSDTRMEAYKNLRPKLSVSASQYWDNNSEQIKKGIISQGKFENYFKFFSSKILPWIHSKKTVQKLLSSKTQKEQELFYENHWNNWRWKLLFKLFFSKYIMGKYGRDPEFLKEVNVSVGDYIFKKAERHLKSKEAQRNFILHYNLTGTFGDLLPHYLSPENFDLIKLNLHKLEIREGYAEDAIKEFGTFHCMNLSNIFEYMNKDLFEKTALQLVNATKTGGKIAYWNLMVPRRISGILNYKVEYQKDTSIQLSEMDKGFFYNQFIIDKVK